MSVLPKVACPPRWGLDRFFSSYHCSAIWNGRGLKIAAGLLSSILRLNVAESGPLPSSRPRAGDDGEPTPTEPAHRRSWQTRIFCTPIDRDERAESAAPFFLAEQHLVEHVETSRAKRPGGRPCPFFTGSRNGSRRADLVDHVLDLLSGCLRRHVSTARHADPAARRVSLLGRLAEFFWSAPRSRDNS